MSDEKNSEEPAFRRTARRALEIESEAISNLIPRLDESFDRAVELIKNSPGRVVVTGMGKSGSVGRKIAATLASTGTPAFFMHPAEGVHGDLGMVREDDVVLAISYSGQTDEVRSLLTPLERIGPTMIAMTGDLNSILARSAEVTLDVSVRREAGPLDLVPTASTTATIAMGDALAMALLEEQDFVEEDFALFHPGGNLGKQLLLKVEDLMHTGDDMPLVAKEASMKEAIFEMTDKRLGITGIVDEDERLIGCLTDGDLRRILEERKDKFFSGPLSEVMTEDPITINRDMRAVRALQIMEKHQITVLFIVNEKRQPTGVVHMHDILRAGIN